MLVVCRLEEVGPGTALTFVETGFDARPAARCEEAYRMHDEGWAYQLSGVRPPAHFRGKQSNP